MYMYSMSYSGYANVPSPPALFTKTLTNYTPICPNFCLFSIAQSIGQYSYMYLTYTCMHENMHVHVYMRTCMANWLLYSGGGNGL